ncbi:DUF1033 family protein [Bacillus sp. RO3]|nr:DUF1033 family protein [Bacillus sp. RO3]
MKVSWRVMTTKSDAEPWWFFEGWQKDIVHEWTYHSKDEAMKKYQAEVKRLSALYPNSKAKRLNAIAFWNPEEIFFCEACDDDLQVYHGLIIFENDRPMEMDDELDLKKIGAHIDCD